MKALDADQIKLLRAGHAQGCPESGEPCHCGFVELAEDGMDQILDEIEEMRQKYSLLLQRYNQDTAMTGFTLSEAEILILLRALKPPEGGYSKDEATARLQAKLSVMLAAEEKLRQVRRDGNN